MKKLAFVLSSVIFLFFFNLAAAADKKPEPQPSKTTEATSVIKGTATIQLRNQNKSILNLMELVLCPDTVASQIKETRDERWRINASRAKFNDGYNNLDLNAIGSLAVRNGVLRAKSDDKGVFQFDKVPPGSYVIYGQYRSNYAVAYWLAPVKVGSSAQEITLDLNEGNLKEAYNRF